jgi:TPR repeat protein
MSASDDEFDGSVDPENDALWNYFPMNRSLKRDPIPLNAHRRSAARNPAPEFGQPPWKRSQNSNEPPQSTLPKAAEVPWKLSQGYQPFVDDTISNKKLSLTPDRVPMPPVPSSGTNYRGTIILAGVAMMTATVIATYKFSSAPPAPLPQTAVHANPFEPPSPDQLRMGVAQPQKPGETGKSTVSAVNNAAAAVNHALTLVNAPPTKSPSTKSEPRPSEPDTMAAKMRAGVDLMTWGEVTKARMLFQRVAEAGEATGAFALAETYDPLVLMLMELREEVMPDLALAHTWYERARDLGSPEARDRISRLAQLGAPLTKSPSTKPEPRRFDTSTVVAKLKNGVELMTRGEVIEARVIFQRAAEAGEWNGAFALAETYDPLVLGQLRPRKEILPNVTLARDWYERARNMGSSEALERISRLARLPQ